MESQNTTKLKRQCLCNIPIRTSSYLGAYRNTGGKTPRSLELIQY